MIENPPREKTLLCVTGLSPQIVTETLHALAVDRHWIPDRIRLITTAEGAKRARLSLLSDEPGWFRRLCADYQLPPIRFTDEDILVLAQADGTPMADIRTPQDNERMADFIVEQVRQLTANPHSELHVSMAGGRKTMGFYLGYALSLFGRPQDRLSHVLVSEPFESCWDFFYPTPYSRVIRINDKNLADTRDASINLAEIPYVSLRHGMTADLLAGRVGFAEAVNAVNQALAPPNLRLDLQSCRIEAAGKVVALTPASLAMLSLFARRVLQGKGIVTAPNKGAPEPDWARDYLHEYRLVKGEMGDLDQTANALKDGMDGEYFSTCKSRLHKELKERLGAMARDYQIDDGGARPKRYSLALSPERITYCRLTEDKARKLAQADSLPRAEAD